MKIYNKDKTQILENYDLKLGYLKNDYLEKQIPEQKEVQEQSHYELVKEYSNGGKEYKKVIDIPYQPYLPPRIEKEEIQVYIPYTQDELNKIKEQEFLALKKQVDDAYFKYKVNHLYNNQIGIQTMTVGATPQEVENGYRKYLETGNLEDLPQEIKDYINL